jgi:beta-galactosidase
MDKILSLGGNVNFYMFFGGTNFELTSGANGGHRLYKPDPTSYDYDAPLSEEADMRWKMSRILDIAKKYRPDIPTYTVTNRTKMEYGTVTFTQGVSVWDSLDVLTAIKQSSDAPMTMESLDIAYGFTLYQAHDKVSGNLSLPEVCDRAYVFCDRQRLNIVEGHGSEKDTTISNAGTLEILVENQGRLNVGREFVEWKGLTQTPKIDGGEIKGWDNVGFTFEKLAQLKWGTTLPAQGPAFYRGTFHAEKGAVWDTFLNPSGWHKGLAWVNGNLLGRYWTIGPQLTLYVPAALLQEGENEVILFEQEIVPGTKQITFDKVPQIDIIK